AGQQLTKEDQSEEKRNLRDMACQKRSDDTVDKAAQQTGQTNEVSLVLPPEITSTRKKRRIERDLRTSRKTNDGFCHQQERDYQHELRGGPHRLEIEESRVSDGDLACDGPFRWASAQTVEEKIMRTGHRPNVFSHSAQDCLVDALCQEYFAFRPKLCAVSSGWTYLVLPLGGT